MKTKKKCKGIGKAYGFAGCGIETINRTYGLCPSCLADWFAETEAGSEQLAKLSLKVYKKIKSTQKKQRQKDKIQIMSADEYRSKYVQPKVNEIVRMIDFGLTCIASGNYGKMSAGHFYSVGSNRTLALNFHNIHRQSFQSNVWKGGDERNYLEGLKNEYGEKYAEFVVGLKKIKPIKLTKAEMIELNTKLKELKKELKENGVGVEVQSVEERMWLRDYCNKFLNIYEKNFVN